MCRGPGSQARGASTGGQNTNPFSSGRGPEGSPAEGLQPAPHPGGPAPCGGHGLQGRVPALRSRRCEVTPRARLESVSVRVPRASPGRRATSCRREVSEPGLPPCPFSGAEGDVGCATRRSHGRENVNATWVPDFNRTLDTGEDTGNIRGVTAPTPRPSHTHRHWGRNRSQAPRRERSREPRTGKGETAYGRKPAGVNTQTPPELENSRGRTKTLRNLSQMDKGLDGTLLR